MSSPKPPPLSEAAKIVQAAGLPTGYGPSTRVLLAGLRDRVPPFPVLASGVVLLLAPLALLWLSGYLVVTIMGKDLNLLLRLIIVVPVAGIPFLLAALAWRGIKRLLHFGAYDDGLGISVLALIGLVITSIAMVRLLLQGEPPPPSAVVPFVVVAVLWLPALFLRAPSAKAWPRRVLLRRGTAVLDEFDAQIFAAVRIHSCQATLPLMPHVLAPVSDETGTGWELQWVCRTCGQPVPTLIRLTRPGEQPGMGGGDWSWVEDVAITVGRADPRTLDEGAFARSHFIAAAGVRALERLLALIPAGRKAVPLWRRTGRAVPIVGEPDAFDRVALESRLVTARSVLAAYDQEAGRRSPA